MVLVPTPTSRQSSGPGGMQFGPTPGSGMGSSIGSAAADQYQSAFGNPQPIIGQGNAIVASNPGMIPGYDPATAFFQGIYGPQQQALAQQQTQLAGQLGLLEANTAQQSGLLQSQHGLGMQGIGLQQQGIGIDRNANNRQLGNIDQLQNLAKQLLHNQFRTTDLQASGQRRGAMSDATARGAMNTPGIGHTLHDINKGAGLAKRGQRLGYQQQAVGFREDRAQVADRNKQLDLRASQLGLDRQGLQNSLDQGLARLQLDQWVGVNDIMDKMQSADLQERMIAEQIYRAALDYSDFFANNPGATGAMSPPSSYASGGSAGTSTTRIG